VIKGYTNKMYLTQVNSMTKKIIELSLSKFICMDSLQYTNMEVQLVAAQHPLAEIKPIL